MTTRQILDLESKNIESMRRHAQFVQDRAITMHDHAEELPDLKNRYGTDSTKGYLMIALSHINTAMASALQWVDYIEQISKAFEEPE